MTAEQLFEQWRERLADGPDDEECELCGHSLSLHEDKYGCDYEADREDPNVGWVAWRCGCRGK